MRLSVPRARLVPDSFADLGVKAVLAQSPNQRRNHSSPL